MKCPECQRTGQESTITMAGGGIVTAMANQSFYDKAGVRHLHNRNIMAEHGRCSNKHMVMVLHGNKCGVPGCEFGHEAEISFVKY